MAADFVLWKFQSNNSIFQDQINQIQNCDNFDETLQTKGLGIGGYKGKDTFIIDLNKIFKNGVDLTLTKRNVLEVIVSIYMILSESYYQKLFNSKKFCFWKSLKGWLECY